MTEDSREKLDEFAKRNEELIEEHINRILKRGRIRRFYEILFSAPQIFDDYEEEVSLVFNTGCLRIVPLRCEGYGKYDHDAMCRPKYSAPGTAEQIRKIREGNSVVPESLRCRFHGKGESDFVLVFPYTFVDSEIKSGRKSGKIEIPYRLVQRTIQGEDNYALRIHGERTAMISLDSWAY